MPVVLAACEEGGFAYEYHHGTIGYGVFTYALAKEFRKAQAARETDVSFTELTRTRKRDDEDAQIRSNLRR